MHRLVTESIVLRVTPYGETSQIASLFTLQEGKVPAIMRTHRNGQEAVSPLLCLENTLIPTHTSLYRIDSYSVIDSHPQLRTEYKLLQQGCLLLQAIDASQQGQKAAPKLYQLLKFYLKRLHELKQSASGVSSFYLKILRHEGLFLPDAFDCNTEEERTVILFLAHVLQWEALIPLVLPDELHAAIARAFQSHFG